MLLRSGTGLTMALHSRHSIVIFMQLVAGTAGFGSHSPGSGTDLTINLTPTLIQSALVILVRVGCRQSKSGLYPAQLSDPTSNRPASAKYTVQVWVQVHKRNVIVLFCLPSKSIFIFFPFSKSSKTLCIKTPEGANRKFIQAVKPFIRVLRLSILQILKSMHICLNFHQNVTFANLIRESMKYNVHTFIPNTF